MWFVLCFTRCINWFTVRNIQLMFSIVWDGFPVWFKSSKSCAAVHILKWEVGRLIWHDKTGPLLCLGCSMSPDPTHHWWLTSGEACCSSVVQTVEHSIMNGGKKMSFSHGLGEEFAQLQLLHHRGWETDHVYYKHDTTLFFLWFLLTCIKNKPKKYVFCTYRSK